ncbi:938_t:CDS:2, partial [Dentiscutata erythropus]
NDNEEFQLGICLLSLDLSLILKLFENAISSNEYDREVQSEKSKGKLQEHEASQISAKLDRINNILEICNWLVKHLSILQLANQIYIASSLSIENIRTFNKSSMLSSAISSKINNNRNSAYIWDKEIKCLFLRARFPSTTCIDEFVKKIFGLNQSVL